MSKSGSFTLVLAVICLSVLMSLQADAQPTTGKMNEVVNLVETTLSFGERMAKKLTDMPEPPATAQPTSTKQALVSALVRKFVSFHSVGQWFACYLASN